jgi:uncharacterized membrane protein YkvA (DUF1232 family)
MSGGLPLADAIDVADRVPGRTVTAAMTTPRSSLSDAAGERSSSGDTARSRSMLDDTVRASTAPTGAAEQARVSPRSGSIGCQARCVKLNWSALPTVLVALAALVYDVSPVDLIPDFLVGPGQADDAVATLIAIGVVVFRIVRARALRQQQAAGTATTRS